MERRLLNTVQFAKPGLLVRREASEEAIKVRDHAFVCLDDLRELVMVSVNRNCELYLLGGFRKFNLNAHDVPIGR